MKIELLGNKQLQKVWVWYKEIEGYMEKSLIRTAKYGGGFVMFGGDP